VVSAHVIIVIQPKHAIIEEEVAAVVAEQVVRLVDIITTHNNGMHQIMVPVETCEVLIVNQVLVVVVTIVFNNKQPVIVVVVKQIKVGGTVRHEKQKNNRKLNNRHPCS
jgi:hypothetical protein